MEELELQPQDNPPELDREPALEPEPDSGHALPQTVSIEEWMASSQPGVEDAPQAESLADVQLLAVLEACVYVAEEPLMPAQIAAALDQDPERVRTLLQQLVVEFDRPEHGVSIKEVAGGFKMATKAEHHEAVRNFAKSLKAPLKLSLPALETLAVIAYKQPVTTPEIMEIRGVQGGGVLKTLLDRKLIAEAGRKSVIGKPILFKTTKEFLIQFGLKDLSELPSLKEFEEIRRMAMSDSEIPAVAAAEAADAQAPAGESDTALESEASAPDSEAVAAPEAKSADVEVAVAGEVSAPDSETAVEMPAPEASSPDVEVAVAGEVSAPDSETAVEVAASEASSPDVEVAAAGEASAPDSETAVEVPTPEASSPDLETAVAKEVSAPDSETAVEMPAVEPEASSPDLETAVAGEVSAPNSEATVEVPDVEALAASESDATAPESSPTIESQDH
jgi:segregation and condensation protein B